MFMEKREVSGVDDRPMINIIVTLASSNHHIYLPPQSTFWDVKKLLAHKTGLPPEEQRIFFKGKEKDNEEHLHIEGVKDKSKLLLLEDTYNKEIKLEEIRKHNDMLKASEAVAGVRAEVDKLSDRVSALEAAVDSGIRVSDKEFIVSTELFMRQLLKLDGIEAEGEGKLQRKAEVRRVQNFVDTLDSLKAKNSNTLSKSGKTISVSTQWDTFNNGMRSLNAPTTTSSSTNVTNDWEQVD
ncbi:hypothetical protein TanjilG_10327 [Lupinus angustifolius]|uniref:Ubiquitin-like domain-containing protein n=1 Tax=Lupinus angustifolius TaxID=3871 RepID=A0A394D5N1_LUPAN|nr:PREDICTED: BAG family molecular chaperone regulator 4-like [Lupinus angustifolius]OIW19148.1 hypothetical protein TanjilG_10327 [Lupinus angustifolius]